jgi:[acyl-carrier-protein] S-malonyltransferase
MAAVLGLDDATIIKLCEEASKIGVAEPVNFNSPGQVVLAGHATAVRQVVEFAKEHGARRAILLPVSVPSHSSLMRDAGLNLAVTLDQIEFKTPSIVVINASTARPYLDAEDIRTRLSAQVYSPVQWVRTVESLLAQGAKSLVESGPGKVLTGLIRRIDRSVSCRSIDTVANLQIALQGKDSV